jgi:hypothetical protein
MEDDSLNYVFIYSSWLWWAEDLYPTILRRPIISPTLKNPTSSAAIIPIVVSCCRSTFRARLRTFEGVEATDDAAELIEDGFRKYVRAFDQYFWNVSTELRSVRDRIQR